MVKGDRMKPPGRFRDRTDLSRKGYLSVIPHSMLRKPEGLTKEFVFQPDPRDHPWDFEVRGRVGRWGRIEAYRGQGRNLENFRVRRHSRRIEAIAATASPKPIFFPWEKERGS